MLAPRYQYDRQSNFELTEIQLRKKLQFESKIASGTYALAHILPCCICGGQNLEILGEKDTYGLPTPVKICRQCGLIQTNPQMTPVSYGGFYNDEYQGLAYGCEDFGDEYFASQYKRGEEIFDYLSRERLLPGSAEPFVLEVGCNSGGILKCFHDRGWRVKGIDLNDAALTFGRTQHGLDLEAGDIRKLALDEPLDLIIYSHTLEHVLQPKTELSTGKRLLKPEGVLYIQVPGIKNLGKTYAMDFLTFIQCAHVFHFSLTTLRNLVEACGYAYVSGDETINAVFRVSDVGRNATAIVNDYAAVMRYLRRAERLRTFRVALVSAVRKIGLYQMLRRVRARLAN